jgi:hypothetical protein
LSGDLLGSADRNQWNFTAQKKAAGTGDPLIERSAESGAQSI